MGPTGSGARGLTCTTGGETIGVITGGETEAVAVAKRAAAVAVGVAAPKTTLQIIAIDPATARKRAMACSVIALMVEQNTPRKQTKTCNKADCGNAKHQSGKSEDDHHGNGQFPSCHGTMDPNKLTIVRTKVSVC